MEHIQHIVLRLGGVVAYLVASFILPMLLPFFLNAREIVLHAVCCWEKVKSLILFEIMSASHRYQLSPNEPLVRSEGCKNTKSAGNSRAKGCGCPQIR
jgi:hypothetical protein